MRATLRRRTEFGAVVRLQSRRRCVAVDACIRPDTALNRRAGGQTEMIKTTSRSPRQRVLSRDKRNDRPRLTVTATSSLPGRQPSRPSAQIKERHRSVRDGRDESAGHRSPQIERRGRSAAVAICGRRRTLANRLPPPPVLVCSHSSSSVSSFLSPRRSTY